MIVTLLLLIENDDRTTEATRKLSFNTEEPALYQHHGFDLVALFLFLLVLRIYQLLIPYLIVTRDIQGVDTVAECKNLG